mgnify:CR=1 FL=1
MSRRTFAVIGLLADLGRYYNIWHPAWPTMWQGNSVLFEVGMCVTFYLIVLSVEMAPTQEASIPTARWRNPPIFPCPYASSARSSKRAFGCGVWREAPAAAPRPQRHRRRHVRSARD